MRLKIKIGKDTVLALKEVENIMLSTSERKITRGELMTSSWEIISPIKDSIDWVRVSKIDVKSIVSQDYGVKSGINTTFNMNNEVVNSLKEFQYSLVSDFEQLVYLPYVLKLVLVATILINNGTLEQYKK